MTQQRKAKRRLSEFDFSKEGSHIALVHKDQGGAASGYSTLITKATSQFSEDFIKKAQRIKVEMELPEFLMRFYNMWYEDEAKELAKLFGWVDYSEMIDNLEETLEGETKVEVLETSPSDYVRSKLQNADRVAELSDAQDLAAALSALTEVQYLTLLEDQQSVEKALKTNLDSKSNSGGKKPVNKGKTKTTPIDKKADKAVHTEENNMSGEAPEVVAKAQFDDIQKAYNEQVEELKKAKEAIELFKKKELEAVEKARNADLVAAVEDKEQAEKLFKAVKGLEAEDFQAVVEVVKALSAKVDANGFFTETGTKTADITKAAGDPVADALKARLQKSNQE